MSEVSVNESISPRLLEAKMSNQIPNTILSEHLLAAIRDLTQGASHVFGASTGYDVLFQGRRYPPKAVVGLAASKVAGVTLGPRDFRGGLNSRCFKILEEFGFTIISKGSTRPFPDEVDTTEAYIEGAVQRITVNRYERDPEARARSIGHYGASCQVCGFDFSVAYGTLGDGFIHVHHTVPLCLIGRAYIVDPIKDLKPVCANCHAMLHKRAPPYTIDELREIMKAVTK